MFVVEQVEQEGVGVDLIGQSVEKLKKCVTVTGILVIIKVACHITLIIHNIA